MKNDKGITRRRLVQGSLGVAALSATGGLLAAGTPAQTEGPFFPIHPQPDTDADMTLIEGHTKHVKSLAFSSDDRHLFSARCVRKFPPNPLFLYRRGTRAIRHWT